MYLSDSEIKRMILKHISDIDKDIESATLATTKAELYKAKSMALEVLVEKYK